MKNRSMPDSTIIPVLSYSDVEKASKWLCEVFGFKLRLKISNHRAQLSFQNEWVVVTNFGSSDLKSKMNTHSIMVRVDDVDSHFKNLKKHETTVLQEPTDQVYGERQYSVIDYEGHVWTFSQTIEDVDPSEWGGQLVQ